MHHDGPDGSHALQHVTRIAEIVHEILTDDFKPIHLRIVSHQVRKVLITQTNALAEIWKPKALELVVLHFEKIYYRVMWMVGMPVVDRCLPLVSPAEDSSGDA